MLRNDPGYLLRHVSPLMICFDPAATRKLYKSPKTCQREGGSSSNGAFLLHTILVALALAQDVELGSRVHLSFKVFDFTSLMSLEYAPNGVCPSYVPN